MLGNYLKVAVRNMSRHKLHAAINIIGLAVGLACSVSILLYLRHETSFDRYHANADRIYRVVSHLDFGGGQTRRSAAAPLPAGPALAGEFPEVERAARLMKGITEMSHGARRFRQSIAAADPDLLAFFDFPLVAGDPLTALNEPNSVVITQAIADKLFGAADPMGEVLTMGHGALRDYRVTGVLREIPRNSHIQFEVLTPLPAGGDPRWLPTSAAASYRAASTYILLAPGADPAGLEAGLPGFVAKHAGGPLRERGWSLSFGLQPLAAIYLDAEYRDDGARHGNAVYLYAFAAIACLVLLTACINFINLATARAARRAREVGLRKTIGARKGQLVGQFLGESLLLTACAFALALGLVELALPALGFFAQQELSMVYGDAWFAGLVSLALLTGLAAGGYPAFYLSSFDPVRVVRGAPGRDGRGAPLRQALVTVQFAVAITLLIGTGVVYRQMEFVRAKDLGVETDHVVSVFFDVRERFEAIKQEWLQGPGILGAAASRTIPFRASRTSRLPTYPVLPEGLPEGTGLEVPAYEIDYDFLDLFGIALVAGRDLSAARYAADTTSAFIVNEAAVRAFGWGGASAAVGKGLTLLDRNTRALRKRGRVIGVVKDFHMQTLHEEITPLVLHMSPRSFLYMSVKIHPHRTDEALAFLQEKRKRAEYDYFFVDEHYAAQHRDDERHGRLLGGFALLAVFVACLGLFGLAAAVAEQRTKEIGVRKALGATGAGVLSLLTVDFARPVLLANLIAWPVAYYAVRGWLANFAYHIDLGPGPFLLGGLLALAVALLTVAYQGLKSARARPVDALRCE